MAFGKKAKTPKTQYQTEQQKLGRAAYKDIEPQRQNIANLTNNADAYRQQGINNFFNSDASWNDAMRNYRRQMAQATANNYFSTGGGYSSAGQKYYDDTQRAANDLNSRLYTQGVNTVENMLGNDRSAAYDYYNLLNAQHGYAAQPDAIDEYNKLVDKQNKQWWVDQLYAHANLAEALAPKQWKAIGTVGKLGANALSTNYEDAMSNIGKTAFGSNYQADPRAVTDVNGVLASSANNYSNWFGLGGMGGGGNNSINSLFGGGQGSGLNFDMSGVNNIVDNAKKRLGGGN